MPAFSPFTPEQAAIFANEHSALFGEHSQLQSVAVGVNTQNRVFRVKNQYGTSLIVKQVLPYVGGAGESWVPTQDRARIEAELLKIHGALVPEHVVEVLHYDASYSALLLEDLSQLQLLRTGLALVGLGLVARGLVMVSGVTPSDASHVLGRLSAWDGAAAEKAVRLLARPDMTHVWPVFVQLLPEADEDFRTITRFVEDSLADAGHDRSRQ